MRSILLVLAVLSASCTSSARTSSLLPPGIDDALGAIRPNQPEAEVERLLRSIYPAATPASGENLGAGSAIRFQLTDKLSLDVPGYPDPSDPTRRLVAADRAFTVVDLSGNQRFDLVVSSLDASGEIAGAGRSRSGKWDEVDTWVVAESMSVDALAGRWLKDHLLRYQGKPRLAIGKITVRSNGEELPSGPILQRISAAFVRSDRIDVAAAGFTRPATEAPAVSREKPGTGAEPAILLRGSIEVHEDIQGRRQRSAYQVGFEIINVSSGNVVWNRNQTIVKNSEQPALRR